MTRRIIFVTGGAGFIGSNIVAKLAEDPTLDLVVCDRLHEADLGKWRNIAKHPIGDFVKPDADKIIQNNFCLSRDLFRWCTDRQRRFIYASSAATYGDGSQGFDDKDDVASLQALRPLNTYGWSKSLFDLFAARQAARGYAPPQWAGLKFFNVYGPNEEHKASMKSVISQIWPKVKAGHTVQLFKSHNPNYEDGGQLRDFVYVRDVAEVVDWLYRNEGVNGVFNLGSGQARSFKDLAEAVFKAAGKTPDIDYIPMPPSIRDKYQYFTQANMDRLREAGYPGQLTPLEDGVTEYVQKYLSAADHYR
ncbi:MAG: ADP-glyceromanno-heptose 6-epimerase [Pseudomonadota bacterium]